MSPRDIVDVQLDSFFGARFPWKMQALVDNELNNGRWLEGYDIAVSPEVIGNSEAEELLKIVLDHNPDWRLVEDVLMSLVDEHLPQSQCARLRWIVDEVGSFALTDSLRVARFDMASISWVTSRLSFDGIEFDSLANGILKGRSWLASSSVNPDSPFKIDFDSGELLEGEVVPYCDSTRRISRCTPI